MTKKLRCREIIISLIIIQTIWMISACGTKEKGLNERVFKSQLVKFEGRAMLGKEGKSVVFDWSGGKASWEITSEQVRNSENKECPLEVQNVSFNVSMTEHGSGNYFNVYVNGKLQPEPLQTQPGLHSYAISFDTDSSLNLVDIVRRTEGYYGNTEIFLESSDTLQPRNGKKRLQFEFFGDSVVAGFGVLGQLGCTPSASNEDIGSSYVQLVSDALSADYHAEAISGIGLVRNYGDPNTTSPAPFPLFWNRTLYTAPSVYDFSKFIPDAIVIHLGGNDFSTEPHPPDALWLAAYHQFLTSLYNAYSPYNPRFRILHCCGPLQGDPCDLIKGSLSSWNLQRGWDQAIFVNWVDSISFPTDYGMFFFQLD